MKGFTSNNYVKECVFAVHLEGTATLVDTTAVRETALLLLVEYTTYAP